MKQAERAHDGPFPMEPRSFIPIGNGMRERPTARRRWSAAQGSESGGFERRLMALDDEGPDEPVPREGRFDRLLSR